MRTARERIRFCHPVAFYLPAKLLASSCPFPFQGQDIILSHKWRLWSLHPNFSLQVRLETGTKSLALQQQCIKRPPYSVNWRVVAHLQLYLLLHNVRLNHKTVFLASWSHMIRYWGYYYYFGPWVQPTKFQASTMEGPRGPPPRSSKRSPFTHSFKRAEVEL